MHKPIPVCKDPQALIAHQALLIDALKAECEKQRDFMLCCSCEGAGSKEVRQTARQPKAPEATAVNPCTTHCLEPLLHKKILAVSNAPPGALRPSSFFHFSAVYSLQAAAAAAAHAALDADVEPHACPICWHNTQVGARMMRHQVAASQIMHAPLIQMDGCMLHAALASSSRIWNALSAGTSPSWDGGSTCKHALIVWYSTCQHALIMRCFLPTTTHHRTWHSSAATSPAAAAARW